MVPTTKRNKFICLVCGFENRSRDLVELHVEQDHEYEVRKRFGLVFATKIQQRVSKMSLPHSTDRLKVRSREGKTKYVVDSYMWKVLYDSSMPMQDKMVDSFTEAFNFFQLQDGDVVSYKLSDHLRNEQFDYAAQCLRDCFKADEHSQFRFLLVPLVDNDFWAVVRIDRKQGKLRVADPREAVILKRHPLVGPLLTALKLVLKKPWVVEVLGGTVLPRTAVKKYSGVLACLNIACWALFRNQHQLDNQDYSEVFGYAVDKPFMQKARHFISRTVYEYGKHSTEVVAQPFI